MQFSIGEIVANTRDEHVGPIVRREIMGAFGACYHVTCDGATRHYWPSELSRVNSRYGTERRVIDASGQSVCACAICTAPRN